MTCIVGSDCEIVKRRRERRGEGLMRLRVSEGVHQIEISSDVLRTGRLKEDIEHVCGLAILVRERRLINGALRYDGGG